MTHQPELLPDQLSPDQATRETERAEYLERLREKLKDPEFRAIEGFPIGEDEDILALSDPPYYTACPNPFLPEIIERWQAERAQLRDELGLPDDSGDNGNPGFGIGDSEPVYHREPFAADVSEGKNDPIYNAHSYHTKVPHERDGMYFLPHQVAEYDRRRMQVSQVEQLAFFVTDEKSAIQWLRRELDPITGSGPQTYQDLQPKFLRELHQARHEALPELGDVLAQNFLKDEQDRWYVPDPARQEDLEKLRERSLLREFQEYAQGKGRLKVFRTEAVRAGFKHAWHERDYRLIVKVAERLPPSVLQEDAGLLMYYDNALMRAESESEQGRLL